MKTMKDEIKVTRITIDINGGDLSYRTNVSAEYNNAQGEKFKCDSFVGNENIRLQVRRHIIEALKNVSSVSELSNLHLYELQYGL